MSQKEQINCENPNEKADLHPKDKKQTLESAEKQIIGS